jgi:hypothetical protein
MRNVVAGVTGAGAAIAVDRAVARTMPTARTESAAAGLLTAAAIYPLARRRGFGDLGEKVVLFAAGGVVAAAGALPKHRTRLIAAGWIAHATFDAAFRTDARASRIPSWYPAMCAGYDIALGALLLSDARR